MTRLTKQHAEPLRAAVHGRVVLQDDADYDEARKVWNGMIDRRPVAIVQCVRADDVAAAIDFARRHGLDISMRGGAHHIAGNAVCDGGLVIDFSRMKAVHVDPERRLAVVEPGATLGDFDEAAQRHGLATPLGINSTTGIAGLTLGGGFGWLTRKHGMTIDNLVSAQVVMADGNQVTASDAERQDLFWALRGGGGNFGVVTQFEFMLHRVGPEVTAGLIVFPLSAAPSVLRQYRDFAASAPDELSVWAVMRHAPPLPFLPQEVHGQPALVLAVFYAGDASDAQGTIAPLRGFGTPWGEHIGAMPYVQWQKAFDPLLTAGARNYWKSHNFAALSDAAIDALYGCAQRLAGPECEVFLGQLGGAASRVPADAAAYGHRDARFVMNVHARWQSAADDKTHIAWARDVFDVTGPYASTGTYVNFMTADDGDRVAQAYGANYGRLAEVKAKYDPDNVFHINQNIKPAALDVAA